jgi:hypothetical protein
MKAYREDDVYIEEDNYLATEAFPVRAGQRVSIIVLVDEEPNPHTAAANRYPLRGRTPYEFADPTSPVDPEDWEDGK